MKRVISILLTVILHAGIIFVPSVTVSAVNRNETQEINGSVVDMADLLFDDEEEVLKKRIFDIRKKYNYDIVIVTTPSTNGKNIVAYCDDLYDYNGYGLGPDNDGMLFCINMNYDSGDGSRDYYTTTTGFGIIAFTDYAIADSESVINSAVIPYLSEDDWYGAFNTYLDLVEIFVAEAKKGTPYDVGHPYRKTSLIGDVNGDGNILADDARLALRASAKLEELSESQLLAADVDGNKQVLADDVRQILRFSAKLQKDFLKSKK